jgi:hypothetical protein
VGYRLVHELEDARLNDVLVLSGIPCLVGYRLVHELEHARLNDVLVELLRR